MRVIIRLTLTRWAETQLQMNANVAIVPLENYKKKNKKNIYVSLRGLLENEFKIICYAELFSITDHSVLNGLQKSKLPFYYIHNFTTLWISLSHLSRNSISINGDQQNIYTAGTCLKKLKAINPPTVWAIPTRHYIRIESRIRRAITFTSSHGRGKLVLPKSKRKIPSSSCQWLKERGRCRNSETDNQSKNGNMKERWEGGTSDLTNDTRYERKRKERLNEFENASRLE